MCKKKAPLVAEPFHRLISLDLSDAGDNADGDAGGAGGGACAGGISGVFRLPIPTSSSLHPLSKGRDSSAPPSTLINATTLASIGYPAHHSFE
jgi:hypothetical protein